MRKEHNESPLIFIGFIFIANFFFLNIMISISCDNFKEVTDDSLAENENDKTFFQNSKEVD